jgi:hypothetical protein
MKESRRKRGVIRNKELKWKTWRRQKKNEREWNDGQKRKQ